MCNKGSVSVWKPGNRDNFTDIEIIMKPKVYVVLQYTLTYTQYIADITRAQLGRPQKHTEGQNSKNKCICILMKCFQVEKATNLT